MGTCINRCIDCMTMQGIFIVSFVHCTAVQIHPAWRVPLPRMGQTWAHIVRTQLISHSEQTNKPSR